MRPLAVWINNLLSVLLEKININILYPVDYKYFRIETVIFPFAVLGFVIWISFYHGRLFCNTVCPVGTLLGLISRLSVFKIKIDKNSERRISLIERFGDSEGAKLYKLFRQIEKAEHMIKRIGKICEMKKTVTPHQMRHSLAMLLKKKGTELDKIQVVLGHSNITTTQQYAITTVDDVKKDYRKAMKK